MACSARAAIRGAPRFDQNLSHRDARAALCVHHMAVAPASVSLSRNVVLKRREDVGLAPHFPEMPLKRIARLNRLICAAVFPSFTSQGAEMALLVMQVAVSGELVEVFEMPVDDVDGHRMLAAANEDERGFIAPARPSKTVRSGSI